VLTQDFLDWWFSPWRYAVGRLDLPGVCALSARDGYRASCDALGIPADLPARFDSGWAIAQETSGARLKETARRYAGLLAARQHDRQALKSLSETDWKWCARIAATQPLSGVLPQDVARHVPLEVRGMAELAVRLERHFPGVWPRLALLLNPQEAKVIESLVRVVDTVVSNDPRAQRCWRLCRLAPRLTAMPVSRTPATGGEQATPFFE